MDGKITEVQLYKPRQRRKIARGGTKKAKKGKAASSKPKQRKLSLIKKDLEALQKQLVILTYGHDCYTCPQKALEGKNCHLGHVPWPRTALSAQAKFLIAYTRIQCFSCNINLGGNGAVAYQRMLDEGIDVVSLRKWSDDRKGMTVPREWYLEQSAEYVDKLLQTKNPMLE